MNDLIPVEHNNQRVMLTSQIAEFYGTTPARINENHSRNKKNFMLGEDYFVLEGSGLKEFKKRFPALSEDPQLKFASILYLWTEYGALMHAKSLQNDKALEVFRELRKSYFVVQQQQKQDHINDVHRRIRDFNMLLVEKLRFTAEEKANMLALSGMLKEIGFAANAFLDSSLAKAFYPWCEEQGYDMSLVQETKRARIVGYELNEDRMTYNWDKPMKRHVNSYPQDPFGLAWETFLVEYYWPVRFLPYIMRKYKGEERAKNIEGGIKVITFFTGLSQQQISEQSKKIK